MGDRPDLEPKEQDLEPKSDPIDVNPEPLMTPPEGCSQQASSPRVGPLEEGHKVVKITEHGFQIIEPKLLPVPRPVECNQPQAPPPVQPPKLRARTVRNEPLLVKPCGMVTPGEPCYTTAIPTSMPTTTTTTSQMPTLRPTTTTTTTTRKP